MIHTRTLRSLTLLAFLFSVALLTSSCELQGGETSADTTDTAVPQELTLAIFNKAFNLNGNPVTSVTIRAGGAITFTVPTSSSTANIVIDQLSIDTPVDPGGTYRQVFTTAGTFTVVDELAAPQPTLSVIVQP